VERENRSDYCISRHGREQSDAGRRDSGARKEHTIEQAPVQGQLTIELEHNPKRPARSATLTVRGMSVTIEVPRHHLKPKQCQPVSMNLLLVEEVNPPANETPIRWLLLTTKSG
jgi:hypothetical protein